MKIKDLQKLTIKGIISLLDDDCMLLAEKEFEDGVIGYCYCVEVHRNNQNIDEVGKFVYAEMIIKSNRVQSINIDIENKDDLGLKYMDEILKLFLK